MINHALPVIFDKIGFAASFVFNIFVIYLTLFQIKKISVTYKKMIIMFSLFGIVFTSVEVFVRPFAHNYNKAIMFFSLNTYLSRDIVLVFLACWGGLFIGILAIIAFQFAYRFLCLFHIQKARRFDRMTSIIWVMYPFLSGGFYALSFYLFCIPDQFSDDFMRETVTEDYGLIIENLARFIMIPYASDNSLRVRSLLFFLCGLFLVWSHYFILFYCGLKMHFNMKHELEKFSVKNRKLQKQFFYALVVQSLGPTTFLFIPTAPILLGPLLHPYLNLNYSWQTGWLYSLMGLYPPFDSISFMLIVSEYRKVIKSRFCLICTDISTGLSSTKKEKRTSLAAVSTNAV